MSESGRVIRQVLDLLATTSEVKRLNVRHVLLAQFGADIIPHCVNKYQERPRADYRAHLVRFVLRYARVDSRSVEFARSALADKSRKVRHNACALLAYSLRPSELDSLQPLLQHPDAKTVDDARRAIDAIQSENHNRFYPAYSAWGVPGDDPDQPKPEDVQRYIVEGAPELAAPLSEIMGDLFNRWSPPTA